MVRLWFFVLLSFLVGCTTVTRECGLPSQDVRSAVVSLSSDSGVNASGVVVAKNLVLTVAHAIDPSGQLYLRAGESSRPAMVQSLDSLADLALLSVNTGDTPALPLSFVPLLRNEPVWVLGFPLALDQRLSLGLYKSTDEDRVLTSTHVNSGNSGGGLLRCHKGQFELAGIVHGYVAVVRGKNTVNLGDASSISARRIVDFIDDSLGQTLAKATVH